jgi:hypothetical protein
VEAIRKAAVAFAQSDRLNDDLTYVVVRIGDVRQPLARCELEIRSDLADTRSVDDVRYSRDERGRNCVALTKVLTS